MLHWRMANPQGYINGLFKCRYLLGSSAFEIFDVDFFSKKGKMLVNIFTFPLNKKFPNTEEICFPFIFGFLKKLIRVSF